MSRTDDRQFFRRNDLLGTVIDVTVIGASTDVEDVAGAAYDEIERLQRIFTTFDDRSELRRWRSGEITPGPELAELAELATAWQVRSGGAFDPGADVFTALWDAATLAGVEPTPDQIAAARTRMRRHDAPWTLNAIAKGWIVDQAARRAYRPDAMRGIVVNAGGDLLTIGEPEIIVGIEDPSRPYDNVPPLTRVAVSDAALATSGITRRGWSIDGAWYGHVIDPRSGRPVDHVTSVSVIAGDATTADVLATTLQVLSLGEGLRLAARLDFGCLIVDSAGEAHRNDRWRAAEAAARGNPRVVPSGAPAHSQVGHPPWLPKTS